MAKIKQILGREILNSAGNPSLEVTVSLSDGITAIASCPSGTSVGSYEAYTLYDRDPNRYNGRGLLKAIQMINMVIAPKLVGIDATKQQLIDRTMIDLDGTQNKGRIGANTMLAVSMAVARAAAQSSVLPLFLYLREFVSTIDLPMKIPIPLFNLVNGSISNQEALNFEDFIVLPATSKTYSEGLDIGIRVMHSLEATLKEKGVPSLSSMQGGFVPILPTNTEGVALLQQAIQGASLRFGFDAFLGIDSTATQFYKSKQYTIKDRNQPLSYKEMTTYYEELMKKFTILYLEDPLAEDDWEGWTYLTNMLGSQALIVGDDLVATNLYRLQMAIDKKAINGIVIKPNQIGTVIEALAVVEVARAAGLKIIVAQRAEETNDDFIADFAVAVSSDYVKFGSPMRGEHVAKYNRLLQIEAQIKLLSAIK